MMTGSCHSDLEVIKDAHNSVAFVSSNVNLTTVIVYNKSLQGSECNLKLKPI